MSCDKSTPPHMLISDLLLFRPDVQAIDASCLQCRASTLHLLPFPLLKCDIDIGDQLGRVLPHTHADGRRVLIHIVSEPPLRKSAPSYIISVLHQLTPTPQSNQFPCYGESCFIARTHHGLSLCSPSVASSPQVLSRNRRMKPSQSLSPTSNSEPRYRYYCMYIDEQLAHFLAHVCVHGCRVHTCRPVSPLKTTFVSLQPRCHNVPTDARPAVRSFTYYDETWFIRQSWTGTT